MKTQETTPARFTLRQRPDHASSPMIRGRSGAPVPTGGGFAARRIPLFSQTALVHLGRRAARRADGGQRLLRRRQGLISRRLGPAGDRGGIGGRRGGAS